MNTFTPGDILKTTGMDMSCNEVEITVEFVEHLDVRTATGFDCVVIDDGVRVLCDSTDLRNN